MLPTLREGVEWLRTSFQLQVDLGKIDPEWLIWYKRNGAPPADLDDVANATSWHGQLRGRQKDPPPPIGDVKAMPQEAVAGGLIGGNLGDTTVHYSTEAFSEGIEKLAADGPTPVPKPVQIVQRYAPAIFADYLVRRKTLIPLQALSLACQVIPADECAAVTDFVHGKQSQRYDARAAYQTVDEWIMLAEFWSGRIPPPEARSALYLSLDIPGMCNEVANDGLSISRFCLAVDQAPDKASELALDAAAVLANKCGQGVSPATRIANLKTAVRIMRVLAGDANNSGPDGTNQFLWCQVIGTSLSAIAGEA
jgi:hypothetical protein